MIGSSPTHIAETDVLGDLRKFCRGVHQEYSGLFLGLLVLQLVTYGYCFTPLLLTNHTFPESWVLPYPSYQTWAEGRWLADAIRALQGGSGVQPFQAAVGVVIQTVNGFLFAHFTGLKKRLDIMLAAGFLCLYPAFLDYYTYPFQHITFAIGDTFALLGILYCKHSRPSGKHSAIIAILFTLTLATYQPKLALVGLLCVCYLAMLVTSDNDARPLALKEMMSATGYVCLIGLGTCLLYLLSVKLTSAGDITTNRAYMNITSAGDVDTSRAYMNSLSEIASAVRGSFGNVFLYYTIGADYLPKLLRILPGVGIGLGCFVILYRAYKRSVVALAIVCVLLSLIPVVLQASFVINKNSWLNAGRIVFAHGYALLFFLSLGLKDQRTRKVTIWVVAACLYFFVVVGTQESNAAAFKTVYDINMINRIASRIETVVGDLYQTKYALVVAGHYPEFPRSSYVGMPNLRNEAYMRQFTFEGYRQGEILNYLFGRNILRRPTQTQMDKALESIRGRRPWPARDSVYVVDDVIVVILEEYRPDLPLTWIAPRQ